MALALNNLKRVDMPLNKETNQTLNNNSFQFNNKNYIQIQGSTLRTKMAPIYSNLTLAYFEENQYESIVKNTATI